MAQLTPVPNAPPLGAGPRLGDTIRSEVTKFRSLRSFFWSFLVAVVIVVGLGALFSFFASQRSPANNGPNDFFTLITASWHLGEFAFLVLGVMAVTNEYATGLVTNTYLATPKRLRVLLAKLISFTVIVLVIAELMSFVSFFIDHAILSAGGFEPILGISGHNVLRAVIGTGVEATLVGIMGMGLGALLRNTAAGIVGGVVVLLVLPAVIAIALPNSLEQPILKYWPTQAGGQIEVLIKGAHELTAGWGLADMTGFVVLLLLLGGWLISHQDA